MKVVFRDLNSSGVVDAVKALLPEWDAAVGDIFSSGQPVDIIVSPANVTGRMDGGIDQIYINRFGWQLEARLMRDIGALYQGRLRIGAAHLITTYDERIDAIPLMICAPTMTWPPQDVSRTEHAYLAFKAVLQCALTEGVKALGREPVLLLPGLGTATGRMSGERCAEQMRRAWDEVWANPPRPLGEWFTSSGKAGTFKALASAEAAAAVRAEPAWVEPTFRNDEMARAPSVPTYRDLLAVACPCCGAGVGAPCFAWVQGVKVPAGRRLDDPEIDSKPINVHPDRVEAAHKARK